VNAPSAIMNLDPLAASVAPHLGAPAAAASACATTLPAEAFPTAPGLTPLDIIGRDDRLPAPDVMQAPWRMVCHLLIQDTRGAMHTGTGWIAGPSTVYTAGHNLLNHQAGYAAARVWVVPGRDGQRAPHGQWETSAFDVHPQWRADQRAVVDVGVVWLAQPIGHNFGWFGFSVQPDSVLRGLPVRSAGYPDDKRPFGTQWFGDSPIHAASPQQLAYGLDTMPGQSGSPVFAQDAAGRAVAVGVHVYGAVSENLAVRISQPIFDTLSRWWR